MVGVAELHLGDGGTSARVMQNLLDDTTNVTVLLSVIQSAKLDSSLARASMRFEDGRLALSLGLHEREREREWSDLVPISIIHGLCNDFGHTWTYLPILQESQQRLLPPKDDSTALSRPDAHRKASFSKVVKVGSTVNSCG